MKSALMTLSALLLCGCATLPGTGVTSSADVARDAAAINDAYARAASGQILLNVLRARDRWPRQYVSLNGITNQPSATIGGTLSLDPFPLGSSDPLDDSTAEITRSQTSNYNYGITPLDTRTINEAVLQPVGRGVFEHYWNSGWSKDLLLLVMANDLRRFKGPASMLEPRHGQRLTDEAVAGLRTNFDDEHWSSFMRNTPIDENEPGNANVAPGDPCSADAGFNVANWPVEGRDARMTPAGTVPLTSRERRCAFFLVTHRMAQRIYGDGGAQVRLRDLPPARCRESAPVALTSAESVRTMSLAQAASNGGMVLRFQRPANAGNPETASHVVLQRCPTDAEEPVLLEVINPQDESVVDATYIVSLRSLDAMIYAMGGLLRAQPEQGHLRLARSPICVAGDCVQAPLFELNRERGRPADFAAFVDYRGERTLAGPAVQWPTEHNYDRTATVLTLLSQLFALTVAPNPDAAAPSRAVVIN